MKKALYKQPTPRIRAIALVVLVISTAALTLLASPLAILAGWGAAAIGYASVMRPDSWLALAQDERNNEEVSRFNLFVDALAAGGVIDKETQEGDIEVDMPAPLIFTVTMRQVGKTAGQLEKAAKASLNALGAVSCEVRRTAPGEYLVVYSEFPPVDELSKIEVSFSDLLDRVDGISLSALPIGVYRDGKPVLASLESRNALLAGVMGSGKSVCLSAMICGLLRCNRPGRTLEKTTIISPKILDFQNFRGACRLISDYSEIMDYLAELHQEIERRKAYCIAAGLKKVSGGHIEKVGGHITVIIDEYTVIKTAIMQDEKGKTVKIGEAIEAELMRLIAEARFASVSFVLALQKADSRNMDTRTRDLISGCRISFASEGKTSAEMVFGEFAANAPCHEIGANHPGVGYVQIDALVPQPFKGAFADDADERSAALYAIESR